MIVRDSGGSEPERLAPVIPLFGAASAAVAPRAEVQPGTSDDAGPAGAPASAAWHPTWHDDPGASSARAPRERGSDDEEPPGRDTVPAAERAEKALLRKLRTRSLSVREARAALGEFSLEAGQIDDILDTMRRLQYLDDTMLAEQLVHQGVDRRGQGRQVIAQTMAKRGVPREIADAALTQMPDDDFERALEFARRKAGAVGGRDAQASLRRLMGQLARRGYPSSVAMTAARQALAELGS